MANEEKARETIEANGAQAYRDGLLISDCPYKTNGPYGRKMRRQWVYGYMLARDGGYYYDQITTSKQN